MRLYHYATTASLPRGFSDAIPNECLIISYLVALSTKNATDKLCIEMKGGFEGPTNDIRSLLIGFSLEILRRADIEQHFLQKSIYQEISRKLVLICLFFQSKLLLSALTPVAPSN